MTKFLYAQKYYETETEVANAASKIKVELDTLPTKWCVVKPSIKQTTLVIDGETIVAHEYGDALNDTQILSLDDSDTRYNVYAVHDGDNHTNLSRAEAGIIVSNIKTSYARWLEVNNYYDKEKAIPITNEDMSGYV